MWNDLIDSMYGTWTDEDKKFAGGSVRQHVSISTDFTVVY
jgi:hypothetical protein